MKAVSGMKGIALSITVWGMTSTLELGQSRQSKVTKPENTSDKSSDERFDFPFGSELSTHGFDVHWRHFIT